MTTPAVNPLKAKFVQLAQEMGQTIEQLNAFHFYREIRAHPEYREFCCRLGGFFSIQTILDDEFIAHQGKSHMTTLANFLTPSERAFWIYFQAELSFDRLEPVSVRGVETMLHLVGKEIEELKYCLEDLRLITGAMGELRKMIGTFSHRLKTAEFRLSETTHQRRLRLAKRVSQEFVGKRQSMILRAIENWETRNEKVLTGKTEEMSADEKSGQLSKEIKSLMKKSSLLEMLQSLLSGNPLSAEVPSP